jgi:DNA-damage-inducible protein J
MEPEIKRKAEGVLTRLGVSPTEAIRIFYRQISLRNGLPFAVEIPNDLTARTLENSRKGRGVVEFDTLEDMAASWET